MPVETTLARAADDLRAGRVALARQRVRGLVRSFPRRLDLRELLADLYRQDGHLAQAGRWSYLAADRVTEEVAAFERMYRTPVERMWAVGWRGDEADAGTATATGRLLALRAEAQQEAGRALDWSTVPSPSHRTPAGGFPWAAAGCLLALMAVLVAVVGGLVRLAGALLPG